MKDLTIIYMTLKHFLKLGPQTIKACHEYEVVRMRYKKKSKKTKAIMTNSLGEKRKYNFKEPKGIHIY